MSTAIFWVLFAIAVGVFASNRGRSGFGWFFLSVLISPLLGFIFCAVSQNLNELATGPSEKTHKKCPMCAELVLHEALICKHCGKDLPPDDEARLRQITSQKEKEADDTRNLIMKFIYAAGLMVAIAAISKCAQ